MTGSGRIYGIGVGGQRLDLAGDEERAFWTRASVEVLRKVELGVRTRDFGTPCVHEHACIRCPALRPDPARRHRLEDILASLRARLGEAHEQGWAAKSPGWEPALPPPSGNCRP